MNQTPPRVSRRVPSDYALRLREKVGHDLIVVPSVAVLLFDDAKRVLLVRYSDRGHWTAPVGTVEPDEHPLETAQREMRNETGIDVELAYILGVFGGPEFRVTHENGDQVGYVMTVYEARMPAGQPVPDLDDAPDIGFFERDRIRDLETAGWLRTVLESVEW